MRNAEGRMPNATMNLIVQPIALEEAVRKLGSKTIVASTLRTAEWAGVPAQLSGSAFMSAGVDWARFLQYGQGKLLDAIALQKEQVAHGTAYVDRSSFIGDMRKLVLGEGKSDGTGGLTDLASRARLGLIFDMQTRSAFGFAERKRGMDPDFLAGVPAQELTESSSLHPRTDWPERFAAAAEEEGDGAALDVLRTTGRMAALKTSGIWSNETFSRFGVPWPPFDFGSTRLLRDIMRDEAEALGLIDPDTTLTPEDAAFTDAAEADLSDFSPDIRANLLQLFGDQVEVDGNIVRWKQAA